MALALEVEAVSKRYGDVLALDRVGLALPAGRFTALLGPNGAGKTTLFQLLSGLFAADGGRILVYGHDLRVRPTAALACLGLVFQQPALDLDLSPAANLRFHTRLHGLDRRAAERRIGEELERVGLSIAAAAPCRTLSGGNRRKVELARALVHRPGLLLMDEATVGLDPGARRDLLDTMHALCAERDMAILWATHLVDEAERAARVVVLHHGRVCAEGTGDELAQRTGAATLAEAFFQLTAQGAPA